MQVKELIKMLLGLDLEKEIKILNIDCEQGTEAFNIKVVRPYEPNGKDDAVLNYGDNDNFYVIDR